MPCVVAKLDAQPIQSFPFWCSLFSTKTGIEYNRTSYARSAEMRLDFNRPHMKKHSKEFSMQVLQGRVEPAGQNSRGQWRVSVCCMCIFTFLPCFHCFHISCLQKEHVSLMSEYIYAVIQNTTLAESVFNLHGNSTVICKLRLCEDVFPGPWKSSHYMRILCILSPHITPSLHSLIDSANRAHNADFMHTLVGSYSHRLT